jgi:tRNA pseudouridine13 synthase
MKVVIKARPQDFIVEEIAALPLSPKGPFRVYLLTKSGRNTVELIQELCRKFNLSRDAISYGGRKDRHSLSSQYIAIKSPKLMEAKQDDFSLKFIGFMKRPMGPDLIQGNKFEVTVRKLSAADIKKAESGIEGVNEAGFANYFDDQRFGSFDDRQGFLAEKVLKQEFNGALKVYLTAINPADKKEEKERKKFFFEHWKDWKACLMPAKTRYEREIFAYLTQKPNAILEVLRKISRKELSMHFSTYQAYLWNEILRRIIISRLHKPYKIYPGIAGDYVFCSSKDDYLEDLILSVPGSKAQLADKDVEAVYHKVLADRGIKQSAFNKLKLRQAFFKSFARQALVKPQDLDFTVVQDEIYPGKKKLTLRFSLPRASFATMLVKAIFS